MPKVLFTASTFSHIINFHLPYLRKFKQLGWRVHVACVSSAAACLPLIADCAALADKHADK